MKFTDRKLLVRTVAIAIGLSVCAIVGAQDKARPSSEDIQVRMHAIGNALTTAGLVQHRVADYRQRYGRFPTSNEEALIAPPPSFASTDISSITVSGDGVVSVSLTESSGVDGGTIIFTPAVSKNTGENSVDWVCTSPSYATISDDTNGVCEYSKLP